MRTWLGLGRAMVPRVQAGRAPGPFPPDRPLFTHVDAAPSRNHIERRHNKNSKSEREKQVQYANTYIWNLREKKKKS